MVSMEFVLFLSSRLPDPEKIKEFKEPLREWEVGDNLFRRSLIFNFLCSRSPRVQPLCRDGARISRISCLRRRYKSFVKRTEIKVFLALVKRKSALF